MGGTAIRRLILVHIQGLVDNLGDGLDVCAQFFFSGHKVESVAVGDEIDGKPQVSEPSRATYPMKVCLASPGEVEVDDDVDCLDVNASGEEIYKSQTVGNYSYMYLIRGLQF